MPGLPPRRQASQNRSVIAHAVLNETMAIVGIFHCGCDQGQMLRGLPKRSVMVRMGGRVLSKS